MLFAASPISLKSNIISATAIRKEKPDTSTVLVQIWERFMQQLAVTYKNRCDSALGSCVRVALG